jgi:hypothetical protein
MLVWQIGENASFDPSVLKLNRSSLMQPNAKLEQAPREPLHYPSSSTSDWVVLATENPSNGPLPFEKLFEVQYEGPQRVWSSSQSSPAGQVGKHYTPTSLKQPPYSHYYFRPLQLLRAAVASSSSKPLSFCFADKSIIDLKCINEEGRAEHL